MARAVDSLSTSAPAGAGGPRQGGSVTSGDFGPCIFSPGGLSYGATNSGSNSNSKRGKSLKQAKGTGRKIDKAPNERSYNQLVDLAEKTPGAEIRM